MVMNTNDDRGFWRRLWEGPVETRSDVLSSPEEPAPIGPSITGQEGPGSVYSAGGTSPLPLSVPPTTRSLVNTISPEEAISIGTVFRCMDIISTAIAQMDFVVLRNDIEIPISSDNSNLIVKSPDVGENWWDYKLQLAQHLFMYGNAYIRVYGEGKNASVAILDPRNVTVGRNKENKKVYYFGGEEVPADKVKHLKHTRIPGSDYGKGPIQLCANEIRSALMLRSYQNEWFDTRIQPQVYLRTDQRLSGTEQQNMSDDFARMRREHPDKPPVMSQGLEIVNPRIKPAEAQFLDVQAENDKNIARMCGVPPVLLNVEIGGTSMTYMNMEQLIINFIEFTLMRYMNEIENALSELLPRGQRVSFRETDLLRGDQVTKWNIIEKQVGVRYTSGDELRKAEGKAPLPKEVTAPTPDLNNKESETENE